eukprot:9556967-Heterocapsa_arctica.AAC.1
MDGRFRRSLGGVHPPPLKPLPDEAPSTPSMFTGAASSSDSGFAPAEQRRVAVDGGSDNSIDDGVAPVGKQQWAPEVQPPE